MKKSVVIFQRRLTEYRVPLFESMRENLARQNVELQVVYGSTNAEDRLRKDAGVMSWGIELPTRYFWVGRQRLVWHSLPWRLMLEADLVMLPHEGALLANYPLIALRKLLGKTWAFWGHGDNLQIKNYENYAKPVKNWLSGAADWWFAYTSLSVGLLTDNRIPLGRIFNLNNAIDTTELSRLSREITAEARRARCIELGLSGQNIGVFIGSLTHEKRLPFLFAAADVVRSQVDNFELVIIGDGPLQEWVREEVAKRAWVRWVGIQQGRSKVLNLSLGKVLLNPGMVGLGILDSFVTGIPTVTTDCGLHSPEIAYLRNDENGIMTENQIDRYARSVVALLADETKRKRLSEGCLADAGKYTLQDMSARFSQGILTILEDRPNRQASNAVGRLHIAIIWQRFLPYHIARFRHLNEKCIAAGYKLTAIEVASLDDSYGFKELAHDGADKLDRLCCFPGSSYHAHAATEIHQGVSAWLMRANPDVILAPATPFPEGMAAVQYRTRFGIKNVMMDDAWEHTDRNLKSWPVRLVKRQLHKCIDAVFVPAESHRNYFESLGFPTERIIEGVDVVDNDYYFQRASQVRENQAELRLKLGLPEKYFLFVGRFLKRKGIETLLNAYQQYRSSCTGMPLGLVLVGSGTYYDEIVRQDRLLSGVCLAGEKHSDELCKYYGLAHCLIVPSEVDPWGLVVNEGMASGLPVIVSRGCGSASTLVKEGRNGWIFAVNDIDQLTKLITQMGCLSKEEWELMCAESLAIISDWSLDRFVQGVFAAIKIPKRPSIPFLSRVLIRLWNGRVSIN